MCCVCACCFSVPITVGWWVDLHVNQRCVEYNSDWCTLTLNLTSTFISGAMCCLPAVVMWGMNQLIRKHSLHLVVWISYSTCPNLLIDLSHLILKICCMWVCGGLTSSKFGHIGYQLVLVSQHQSGIGPQSLLMELILGMPIYIGLSPMVGEIFIIPLVSYHPPQAEQPPVIRCWSTSVSLLHWVLGSLGENWQADCKSCTRLTTEKEEIILVTSKLEC